MKKLFLAMCMVLISASSFAQEGKTTFGLQGNYMIDSPHNFGIGANVGYEFIENIRGVAEFNYFFKAKETSWWNLEANAEYLFHVSDVVTIYPLAGLDFTGVSVDGHTDTKLGLTLGVGVEYAITDKLSLKGEFNYKTQYDGWSLLKFGIVMPF